MLSLEVRFIQIEKNTEPFIIQNAHSYNFFNLHLNLKISITFFNTSGVYNFESNSFRVYNFTEIVYFRIIV